MKRLLSYPISAFFYLNFGFLLVFFHVVQVIAYYLGGYHAHKRSVDLLNYFLIHNLALLGSAVHFRGFDKIPAGRQLIIVSNHQSMFDIPAVVWGFRAFHTKFISKKELGRNIPSISFNLKHGGSLLIDRGRGAQALKDIAAYGASLRDKKFSICIFPEGTRSANGALREFKAGGLKALVTAMPEALIVPFAIDGHYKLFQTGSFPLEPGHRLTYTALAPIEPSAYNLEDLAPMIRQRIASHLGQA